MLVVVKDRCVWNKREKKSNNAVCWRYSSAEGIQRRIWKLLVQMLLGMRRLVRISLGKGGFDQLLSEKLLWSIKSMAHQTWNCACQQLSLCPSEDIPLLHILPELLREGQPLTSLPCGQLCVLSEVTYSLSQKQQENLDGL